jgi:quinol monooxygenase YgiN
MYGTIARMRIKPGALEGLMRWGEQQEDGPGLIALHVFQMDADPNELYLVVVAENEEIYRANANSPEQHQSFLEMMQFLVAEPEWHDGHVVQNR